MSPKRTNLSFTQTVESVCAIQITLPEMGYEGSSSVVSLESLKANDFPDNKTVGQSPKVVSLGSELTSSSQPQLSGCILR